MYTAGPFRALSHDFSVRTTDAGLARYVEVLFEPFRTSGAPGGPSYTFIEDAGSSGCTVLHATSRLRFERRDKALAWFLWHVHQQAVAVSPGYLMVHAGGVEAGGRAVVLPGPSGAGKTTLVAGLLEAGLRYLSDEVVAFRGSPPRAHPYAKHLSLKPGSQRLLPHLRPAGPAHGEEWQVPASAIRPEAVAPSCRPAFVIAPRYEAGRPTRLIPMTRAEAVAVLAANSFNLAHHGRSGLAMLAELVEEAGCHRLVHSNLDHACRLMLDLLER